MSTPRRTPRLDEFTRRVNLALSLIQTGQISTRAFDACFEMYDGELVAVAVYRRTQANPALIERLWRGLGREITLAAVTQYAPFADQDLPRLARQLRTQRYAEAQANLARWQAELQAGAESCVP